MALAPAESVMRAAARISTFVNRTRMIRSSGLSRIAGADVRLKLENEQRTGSFKVRGATNVVAMMTDDERARGVAASSAGNHGLGVAYAAKEFGVTATIFIPRNAPRVKREGILALGATVMDEEPNYDAAMVAAIAFARERGSRFIHPCLGDGLLAGQGTVALEVLAESPGLRTFVVNVGGGGLLGGCAGLLRDHAPSVRIAGAQTTHTAAMAKSLAANRVVEIEDLPTLADGLAGQVDDAALAIGRAGLDEMVTVTEEELGRAMLWLLDEHGLRVEGAGAAGVAAILSGRLRPIGETVVVVSGGNVDDDRIAELRARVGLAEPGRS
ncbi:MAG TPA: pyridoxal-phosphate dependent enzyme [Gemmatimonadaceae bacterium]|nr:pyridoxal-phosphate dependent enzyme [Gemmatimonadaceae bacterium]